MSDWFAINNIEEFTNKTRAIVYNNFGLSEEEKNNVDTMIDEVKPKDQKELDKVLSHKESLSIIKENVKKERNKKTKKIRYVLNEEIFAEIIYKLNSRMVSNILSGLVTKGLVESAFDNESNDFVFWVNDENKKEKPETD